MSTTLFFVSPSTVSVDQHFGTTDSLDLLGARRVYYPGKLHTSRGAGVVSATASTVAGPTAGIEVKPLNTSETSSWYEFLSLPLAAAVTISGSVTWNIWAAETNMADNAAINAVLEKVSGSTGAITLIDATARTTELGTTQAAANFAETPAAGVSLAKGDRLRVRIYADDAGTMSAPGPVTARINGTTGAAEGDSFVTLTENLSFVSAPAGSVVYPTDTASDVSTAVDDKEAWTSRGAGVTNTLGPGTAIGPVSLTQCKNNSATNDVDWFTKPLSAMTLSGAVAVNLRASCDFPSFGRARIAVEIARVDNDGSNPTVWAIGWFGDDGGLNVRNVIVLSEQAYLGYLSGDDLSISGGQRLRIRFYTDDGAGLQGGGSTPKVYYAGTSGGASGDTFVTFSQTLTEYKGALPPLRPGRAIRQMMGR